MRTSLWLRNWTISSVLRRVRSSTLTSRQTKAFLREATNKVTRSKTVIATKMTKINNKRRKKRKTLAINIKPLCFLMKRFKINFRIGKKSPWPLPIRCPLTKLKYIVLG
jgi:prophage antirepressor-like protein